MNNEDEMWHKLTKEYLTTKEKLAIIREYNQHLSQESFDIATKHLIKYIDDKLLKPPTST